MKSSQPLKTKRVLLTGATGVLGAHLLKELILETDSTIFCIVRGDDGAHARERALSYMATYDLDGSAAALFDQRVVSLAGDITQPLFGMTPAAYQELIEKTDATIHAAASTSLLTDFERISAINVGGTKNVIDFVLQTAQRYICYVSSYSIMGDKSFAKGFVFREKDLDVGQGFAGFPYQETKFISEKDIQEAGKRGLIWNIVRPGQIYGDSQSGAYPLAGNTFGNLFYDIFRTLMLNGILPNSDWYFDITPVDFVSKGLVHLALKHPAVFETFHLTNPDVKPFHQTFGLLRELGYPLVMVPTEEYLHTIQKSRVRLNGKPYRSTAARVFGSWQRKGVFNFQDSARVDASYTTDVLKKAGISCPKIDVDLIGTYVQMGIRENFYPPIPAPVRASAGDRVVASSRSIS